MDPFDLPMPRDVEGDLKQIVHELKRWEALPLYGLRALPSVRSLRPPPADDDRYEGQPARRTNAAIRKRIEEATQRTVLEKDQEELKSLFTFDTTDLLLRTRHDEAAGHRGGTPESFRKISEKKLLRALAEEMYRWELAQAVSSSVIGQACDLDTG